MVREETSNVQACMAGCSSSVAQVASRQYSKADWTPQHNRSQVFKAPPYHKRSWSLAVAQHNLVHHRTFLWTNRGVSDNNSREPSWKPLALRPGVQALEGGASVIVVIHNATPDVP